MYTVWTRLGQSRAGEVVVRWSLPRSYTPCHLCLLCTLQCTAYLYKCYSCCHTPSSNSSTQFTGCSWFRSPSLPSASIIYILSKDLSREACTPLEFFRAPAKTAEMAQNIQIGPKGPRKVFWPYLLENSGRIFFGDALYLYYIKLYAVAR